MIEIDGQTFLKPREIAERGLIVNSKGRADYKFILNLIKTKQLAARQWNQSAIQPHYVVSVSEIERYNQKLVPDYKVKL